MNKHTWIRGISYGGALALALWSIPGHAAAKVTPKATPILEHHISAPTDAALALFPSPTQLHANHATFSHNKTAVTNTDAAHATSQVSHHAVSASTIQDSQSDSTPYTVSGTANNDIYWMSRAIQAEAGGESYECKLAVGQVILNRAHSRQYPNSVKGVIFEVNSGTYEFTSVANGHIYNVPSSDSIRAAEQVLSGSVNVVPNALVFYNSAETPVDSWVRTQPVITQIGRMTFAV